MTEFPICGRKHLEEKTKEHSDKRKKKLDLGDGGRFSNEAEEFGVIRLREILAGFRTGDPEGRCGCPVPCKQTYFRLQSWKSDTREKEDKNVGFALFQVPAFGFIIISVESVYHLKKHF